MNVSQREMDFCHLYLETGNASLAYRETLCKKEDAVSTRICASKVLKKPHIQSYLQCIRNEMKEKCMIKFEEIVERLLKVAEEGAKTYTDDKGNPRIVAASASVSAYSKLADLFSPDSDAVRLENIKKVISLRDVGALSTDQVENLIEQVIDEA